MYGYAGQIKRHCGPNLALGQIRHLWIKACEDLLKTNTSVTRGYYSLAPPWHGTFNIFGEGIGVDNKVGEVGCPGRDGESVRINKESNDMEINFSWLVFLALLALTMGMKKDS